jgi:hypothetical protein
MRTPPLTAGTDRTATPRPTEIPRPTAGRTATRRPAAGPTAGVDSTASPRPALTPRPTTEADRTADPHQRVVTPQPTPHPTVTPRPRVTRRPTTGPGRTATPQPTEIPYPTAKTGRTTASRRTETPCPAADPAAGRPATPHPTAVTACRSAHSWASRSPGDGGLTAAWLATTVASSRGRAGRVFDRDASCDRNRTSADQRSRGNRLAAGSVPSAAGTSLVTRVTDHAVGRQVTRPHSLLVIHLVRPGPLEEPVDDDVEAGLSRLGAAAA